MGPTFPYYSHTNSPWPYTNFMGPGVLLMRLPPCEIKRVHREIPTTRSLRRVSGKLCSNPARHTAVARGIPSWYHGVQKQWTVKNVRFWMFFWDCLGNFPNPFRKSWKLTYLKLWIVEIIYHLELKIYLIFFKRHTSCRKTFTRKCSNQHLPVSKNEATTVCILWNFWSKVYWKPHHLPRVIPKDFGTSQREQNFPKGSGICLFVGILTPTPKLLMCEAILAKKTRKLSTTIFAGDIVVFNVWSNKGGHFRWNPSSFSEVSLIGNLSWSHLNVWDLTGVLRILCCHEFEGHNTWLTQFGSCQVSKKQYDMSQRINISVYVHMFAQNRCIIGFP